jgi:hypothetical protein
MEETRAGHMVIDLTDSIQRSALARVQELMALETDPGWIAGTLNREGYHPPHDGPWSPEDVLRLMEALGDELVPAKPAGH